MANLASPNVSPTIAARGRPAQAGNSPSPAPLPQTKRDKRRTMLSDRLSEMITMFSAQHQHHYYAQLSAIQCDINLVMRADPYANGPLDDTAEGIAAQVAEVREEICRSRGRQIEPEAEESFRALGGKTYASYVEEVNAAMEQRDTELTMLMNEYHDGLAELRKTNQYKMQLAQEEHALLSKTLRDRLIQSVTQKRAKLMRDKEQLDIADSSAVLLNPNQFSLGNPASPGGGQGNRKTRHTRLRPGDAEEIGNAAAVEGNKRKRKTAFEENDNESPAPSGRNGDNGMATPYRDAKAKITHAQFEAPLYSVDRLFTEKDLALNMNKAHKATFTYFNRLKAQQQGQNASNGSGTASSGDAAMGGTDEAPAESSAVAAVLANVDASGEVDADATIFNPSPSLLYYLPRASSQTYHATRSQRSTGLDVLSAAATGSAPFAVSINATASKANPQAPPPAILEDTYIHEDLELMGLAADNSDMKIMQKRCLDKSSLLSLGLGQGETGTMDGDGQLRTLPAVAVGAEGGASGPARTTALTAVATHAATAGLVGGESMSKTASTGGINEIGGPAGGTAMRRSASTRT